MDIQTITVFVAGAFLGAVLGRMLTLFVLAGGLIAMLLFRL